MIFRRYSQFANRLSEYLLENESFHRRTSNVRVQNGPSFYEYEIVIVAGFDQFPKSFRDPRAMRSVRNYVFRVCSR